MTTGEGVSAGDAIARELQRRGVRSVYGFPGGGSNLALLDVLRGRRHPVRSWPTPEAGAGFMACAEAELRDAPGMLVVGNGPG